MRDTRPRAHSKSEPLLDERGKNTAECDLENDHIGELFISTKDYIPKLHAGFGILGIKVRKGNRFGCVTASLAVAVLTAFVSCCLLCWINVAGADVYIIPSPLNETTFFLYLQKHILPDDTQRVDAMSMLTMLPFFFGIINYLVAEIRRTTFWWDENYFPPQTSDIKETDPPKRRVRRFIDPLAFPPFLLVVLWTLQRFCLMFFEKPLANHLGDFCKFVLVLFSLLIFYYSLDCVEELLHAVKQKEYDTIRAFEHIKKTQEIVSSLAHTGKKKDDVQSFRDSSVPAEILQYAWWSYYIFAKLLGLLFAVSVFTGFTLSLVVVMSGITAVAFVFDLGANIMSLVRLALFKPFYVGDLVTLNSSGSEGMPATSIMGFIENITISYIVVRNFEMKQVWITHKKFSELVIQNWTRRSTKTVLLNFGISCECSCEKVERLAEFGKQWIQLSPDIMNGKNGRRRGYTKCHITSTGNGYNIQVIFYPDLQVSHREIRQKFILAFMGAAEQLKIPFIPLNIQQNFCKDNAEFDGTRVDGIEANLKDLMPKEKERMRRKTE